jgi:predicted branched-subunit amino acid permease
LLGIAPFGVVVGVAMVAGGIPPLEALAMNLIVYAGASMLAAAQLLSSDTPVAIIVTTVFFINLRFMMYSASLRQHLPGLPLRWKALSGYLLADNAYGMSVARFTEHPEMPGKLGYYLGVAVPIWLVWQLTVGAGIVLGAGLPAAWRLEFAGPLAFIALTIPFLRSRAAVATAVAAAAAAVVFWGLPARLGIAAAAVVGMAVGMLLWRKR